MLYYFHGNYPAPSTQPCSSPGRLRVKPGATLCEPSRRHPLSPAALPVGSGSSPERRLREFSRRHPLSPAALPVGSGSSPERQNTTHPDTPLRVKPGAALCELFRRHPLSPAALSVGSGSSPERRYVGYSSRLRVKSGATL